MKILFCNWLHWVFPKNNDPFKTYLKEKGVECIDLQPCEIGHCNRQLINPILLDRKPSLIHRGFNVDEFLKTEVAMEAHWYTQPISTMIKYRKWVMYLIDWAFETFEREKPDYIVVEGGLTYLSRPLIEVARELGIKIIAMENSFIKDKIFIDFNTGYIVNRFLFAQTSQNWINTRYLTYDKEKEVNKIIYNTFKNLNYITKGNLAFDINLNKKTLLVPLQVYSDQVTLYDSAFNNETFLKKIFSLAKNEFKDWNIILKCHPKEEKNNPKATGDWLESQKLPSNIILIRGALNSPNTQNLIKQSNLVFVNTSQAGLEACLLGKPVVVFGNAFYANKGFTLEYNEALNWHKIKENPEHIVNLKKAKLWFLYFYKQLFNKELNDIDKQKINKELNLK